MTKNTKISAIAARAISAAVLLALPAAAAASSDSDDIVVLSQAALENWKSQTTAELNRALSQGINARGTPNDAIVQVTFTLDENGDADNLQFHNGEGNWFARGIARRAIQRLDDLDQVPVNNAENVQFMANIIFAQNRRVHDKLAARLVKMEELRLASKEPERTYIALGY